MKVELPEIGPDERTPAVAALLGLIRQLLDRVAQLEQVNQERRDEIAQLKGLTQRPDLKPSALEGGKPKTTANQAGKRPGSAKRPKTTELTIHQEVRLHPEDLPAGATLRCYEPYVVQELRIDSHNTRFLRARDDLPDGGSVLAPFPPGVLPVEGGHFGANLIAFILDQYHQAQVTEPLLLAQRWEYGIDISTGQLHRILTENKELFHQEKDEVRAAGLLESPSIGTDDTGARQRGQHGYCTVIGNDLFACFENTDSNSRLNFLQVLQGGQRTQALNETALAYWKRQKLAADVVAQLNQDPREFGDEAAGQARLAALAITNERQVSNSKQSRLVARQRVTLRADTDTDAARTQRY